MQTFLPLPSIGESAAVLDRARLGKQRVEVKQILNTLLGRSDGWKNHPAVKMWTGHELGLAMYGIAVCKEWRYRGYKDNLLPEFESIHSDLVKERGMNPDTLMPPWFGNDDFHSSHRAALLAKDFSWYKKFGWSESPVIDYVWPVS
jgi:hypothetical protein